ncbi:MAG TPA: CCA tRNA nucleotidyltransferase [Gemmatimonadales bacterium]|nr:CCA tRNA nucleotidyltransferase [Gemmatimonadales bacterium]
MRVSGERGAGNGPGVGPGRGDPEVPSEVLEIVRTLEGAGHEAWCVGGALRDAILGRSHADFDIATAAVPDQVLALFRRTVPVGLRFGTVGVLDGRGGLHEVTTFRRDVATDGRHAEVAYGVSLEEDLARRDFTVNALAWHPLRREWRDPFGGEDDLRARILRAVGDPATRFREDYLRVLRALRFAARLDFAIEPATWAAACAAAEGLHGLSAERVRDEWMKGLATAVSLERFLRLWHQSGAATAWMPGLVGPDQAPWTGIVGHDPGAPRDPVLFTIVLTANPPFVLTRLRASNAEVARAHAVMKGPLAPESSGPAAVRRWLSATGPAADDLMAIERLMTGARPAWGSEVARIRLRRDPLTRADLAVDGTDLAEAGIAPGPALGRVLEGLLAFVLEDPERNRRDTLLARARELA